MLINFASNVVGTRITSDKVSTDGFECSNLISTNWHQRRKGFMVEHFIKPPVNITFEFPCNVCIYHVSLTPSVGQQLSSHLELYSATKLMPKTKRGYQKLTAASLPEGSEVTRAGPAVSHSLPIFYPIAKMCISDGGSSVCFYNPKVPSLSDGNMADIMTYKHRAEIRHFRQEIINASSHLTLRIVRTSNASTAAVSNISIWGVLSPSTPARIRDEIVNKYTTFLHQSSVTEVVVKHEPKVASMAIPSTGSVVEECQELDIPEDFLDPITCEVMAMPMLLPSGKNVDQCTLDRYFSAEATYGRQPRDPFTGVQFSNTNRPVPNGGLKARIDKFLMEHSDDTATFKMARTVGTGQHSSLLGKRKYSAHARGISSVVLKTPGVQLCHLPSDGQTEVSTSTVTREPSALQKCHQARTEPKSSSLGEGKITESLGRSQISGKKQVISPAASCSSQTEHSAGPSHETQLKNSLNSALSSILSCLPSHPPVLQNTASNDSCFLCHRTLSDQVSYVTPCDHFLCRDCLTSDSITFSMTCRVCQKTFTKRDVVRRHLIV